jgi:hypothetical protein
MSGRRLAGESGPTKFDEFSNFVSTCAKCNKAAKCLPMDVIGLANVGGDASLIVVHVTVGTT